MQTMHSCQCPRVHAGLTWGCTAGSCHQAAAVKEAGRSSSDATVSLKALLLYCRLTCLPLWGLQPCRLWAWGWGGGRSPEVQTQAERVLLGHVIRVETHFLTVEMWLNTLTWVLHLKEHSPQSKYSFSLSWLQFVGMLPFSFNLKLNYNCGQFLILTPSSRPLWCRPSGIVDLLDSYWSTESSQSHVMD